MQILDNLFDPQLTNLQRGLDRATQRHGLLVKNLANINTPGYHRQDMDFNIELEGAAKRFDLKRLDDGSSDGGPLREDGNNVEMEREVTAIAETELRYQMLTDMTKRYFSGLRNVIREGR